MKKKTEAEIASEKAAIAAQLTDLLKVGNGNAILNKPQAAAVRPKLDALP